MAKYYYSMVLDHTADQVWTVVRLFNRHEWTGASVAEGAENSMPGDTAGAVRRAYLGGRQICQRLVGHSDLDRSYTYENCQTVPEPMRSHRATIRVCPIVETGNAFVEWWANSDDGADDGAMTCNFSADDFAKSLMALRSFMASRNAERVLRAPAGMAGRRLSGDPDRSHRAVLRLV
jgi:Polyketide cyclase / dehydrase and lipid transport